MRQRVPRAWQMSFQISHSTHLLHKNGSSGPERKRRFQQLLESREAFVYNALIHQMLTVNQDEAQMNWCNTYFLLRDERCVLGSRTNQTARVREELMSLLRIKISSNRERQTHRRSTSYWLPSLEDQQKTIKNKLPTCYMSGNNTIFKSVKYRSGNVQ